MFWLRRIVLVLLVVVAPVGLALWIDGVTATEGAKQAGARAVSRAADALSDRVALVVRQHLDEALAAAHDLEDTGSLEALEDLGRPGRRGTRAEEAAAEAEARLAAARPKAGFSWLVDGSGMVLAAAGGGDRTGVVGRDVGGHPLFLRSQTGIAGDMPWRDGSPLVWGAAAPLVLGGRARGAVVVGWPVDQAFIAGLAQDLGVELTLLRGDAMVHTTLERPDAEAVLRPAFSATQPVTSGTLAEPLASPVPGLPLFIGPRADGLAYSSMTVDAPGGRYRYVVTVPEVEAFETVAARQLDLIAAGVALMMILLLFAVMDHRTYVAPIQRVSDHLSEIQLGRGELELPEVRVSKPFRRLVRLINMTVQKLPSRSMSSLSTSTLSTSSMPSLSGGGAQSLSAAPEPNLSPSPRERGPSAPAPAAAPSGGAPDEADDIAAAIAALSEGGRRPDGTDQPGAASPPPASPAPTSPAPVGADPGTPPAEPRSPSRPEPVTRAPEPEPAHRRSAAEVRGATPAPDLTPDLTDDFLALDDASRPGVRGGGSFGLTGGAGLSDGPSEKPEGDDATRVAQVEQSLLQRTARSEDLLGGGGEGFENQDNTVIADVDPRLLSQTAQPEEDADLRHFKQVYEDFVDLRRKCGERTEDLGFERFLEKLKRNRAKLVDKYNCKTVRFQVYEKDGKAALKATPVRSR